ncbi:unnamed protein product [Prorocentrum cordatum]|uniref:Uncharacterized protein n=1 Tax=Prorocentrum cordatum TaxID=2364126 RepID=A0ABN9Y6B5_9DINO|nr:unnamed protein product [Polarella glacialis]
MQGSNLEEALKLVAPAINKLASEHLNGDISEIKSAADKICSLLLEHGLAYRQHCDVAHVGVHSDNRGGVGVEVCNVHKVLLRVVRQGWSKVEVAAARCFEMPPGARGAAQWKFNQDLAVAPDGYLAPFSNEGQLRFLTVAGYGSLTDEVETSAGNRVSRDKVLQLAPSFAEPLDHGIDFLCIKHQVESYCPELAGFLQVAGNSGHDTEQAPSKIATMLSIHKRAAAQQKLVGSVDWSRLAASLERTAPYLSGQCEDLGEFVKHYSGGTVPIWLHDLDGWSKTCRFLRDVDSRTFKIIAGIKYGQGAEYIVAMVKAAIQAPEAFVRDGVSKLITSSDAQQVTGSKKILVDQAVAYIRAAKAWLPQVTGMSHTDKVRVLADAEIRFVMFIHGKKAKGRPQFSSLRAVANQFLEDVAKKDPLSRNLLQPWTDASDPDEKATPESGEVMVEYAGQSVTAAAIARAGFIVGSTVVLRSGDRTVMTIAKIDSDAVWVKAAGRARPVSVACGKFLDEYQDRDDQGSQKQTVARNAPKPPRASDHPESEEYRDDPPKNLSDH